MSHVTRDEDCVFIVSGRLRKPADAAGGKWLALPAIHPKTAEDAERNVKALTRAMPAKEFRWECIYDEDIPF